MEYINLTGTGLKVSRLCVGTMMFGGQVNEVEGIRIVRWALDNGMNFIDTADVYTNGESERITGRGLKGRRSEVVLASKVFNPVKGGVNDRGLSRGHIIRAAEDSLARLGTDYIDIYYLHQPDYDTPIDETLETMTGLVKSGKVRYVGVSNYAAWQIMELLRRCDNRGFIPPVVTQNIYNMINRDIEQELIPCLKAAGMGLTVYSPLASGLLSGKHCGGVPAENSRFSLNKVYYDRYWKEENLGAAEALGKVASEEGISQTELALRWCLSQKQVASVVTGMSSLLQLQDNAAATEAGCLSPDVLQRCDGIWQHLKGNRFPYNR